MNPKQIRTESQMHKVGSSLRTYEDTRRIARGQRTSPRLFSCRTQSIPGQVSHCRINTTCSFMRRTDTALSCCWSIWLKSSLAIFRFTTDAIDGRTCFFRSRVCAYLADDDHGPLALQEILLAGCTTVGVRTGASFVRTGETGVVVDRLPPGRQWNRTALAVFMEASKPNLWIATVCGSGPLMSSTPTGVWTASSPL